MVPGFLEIVKRLSEEAWTLSRPGFGALVLFFCFRGWFVGLNGFVSGVEYRKRAQLSKPRTYAATQAELDLHAHQIMVRLRSNSMRSISKKMSVMVPHSMSGEFKECRFR